jgi:hypothetical protein
MLNIAGVLCREAIAENFSPSSLKKDFAMTMEVGGRQRSEAFQPSADKLSIVNK